MGTTRLEYLRDLWRRRAAVREDLLVDYRELPIDAKTLMDADGCRITAAFMLRDRRLREIEAEAAQIKAEAAQSGEESLV